MRLLLCSDLHRDLPACQRLVEMSAQADLVIAAGDFATMRKGLADTIAALRTITTPTVVVPGNAESDEELRQACLDWPAAHVLHGEGTLLLGLSIWGVGGAVPPTPFGDWSFDLSEDVAASRLHGAAGCDILITHAPPKGCLDSDSQGRSLGSRAVRDALRRSPPKLLVCGHIHASAGRTEQWGETTVVNAGPAGVWFDTSRLPASAP